ncbi:MAG: HAMP domain-containing histidine kinase [Clostridia bacterium]|nr:HAMP domain-containing histidine kinase [Clostridia bacterium]
MRKKMTVLILAASVPILIWTAFFMSGQSFALSLEREKQRTQMTETIIFREIRDQMAGLSFAQAAAYARQYRDYYAAQGIELIFCWNGQPIADGAFPNDLYMGLLQEKRCALLDTISVPQKYAIAEPVSSKLTMILLRDVGDLYLLRDSFRKTAWLSVLVAIAVLAGIAFVFSGALTKPIRKLTEAAKALASEKGERTPLPIERRDEIGTLARSFSDMRSAVMTREKRLSEESDSRQRLLDALAHEMRTPLTSLLGNARLLQLDLPAEQRKPIADSMSKEIKRLADMDRQLMKLTELGHEVPEMEAVSTMELMRDTAKRLQMLSEGVRLEAVGTNGMIWGDRELLTLLADNLTANAIQASKPGTKVTLEAKADGFAVCDRGIGMSEETLTHLGEPFYKADKARTRAHGGAGLGLSVCQRIADLHQGSLDFASAPGEGTKAVFTCPLQPVDDSVTGPVA